MIRKFSFAAVTLAALIAPLGADDKDAAKPQAKNESFEKMKKLVGTWVQADENGKPTDKVISVYKLTGAGSALHETIFPGAEHEMVSVYHLDGTDLVLTHYCALQNQPKMKLDPKSTGNTLKFEFAGGTNINPAKDLHMHEGVITIVDDDHLESTWQAYADGKPAADHKATFKLVRKKDAK